METKKTLKVVTVVVQEASEIWITKNGNIARAGTRISSVCGDNLDLYLLSDDTVNKGDLIVCKGVVGKADETIEYNYAMFAKVVATTNKKLINEGVFAIPEYLVQAYVASHISGFPFDNISIGTDVINFMEKYKANKVFIRANDGAVLRMNGEFRKESLSGIKKFETVVDAMIYMENYNIIGYSIVDQK